jgi:hypothetical protein
MYPLVLQRVLETELPEVLLSHKDDILETLEAIANDESMLIFFYYSNFSFIVFERVF